MEVVFSTRAKKKLDNLLYYLETEWSINVKYAFVAKLDHSMSRISRFPESCPVSSQKKGVYQCIVSKHTTLYYRIKLKEIEIITLFDNRQNPKKLNL
jgi:plasmid stabilization system protein ParE